MAGAGHGLEGTRAGRHTFGEFVRGALHAAADQVEPRADGLESIWARIGARSRLRDRLAARRQGTGSPRSAHRGEPGTGTPGSP